ncbi:hypothetical protein MTO96_036314, partial [Rhipicephalus appendiculatus]
VESARTRPQRENKSTGGRHVSSLEAAHGSDKAATSKRLSNESEEEEEKAASGEVAPTAAANEDESADSKGRKTRRTR